MAPNIDRIVSTTEHGHGHGELGSCGQSRSTWGEPAEEQAHARTQKDGASQRDGSEDVRTHGLGPQKLLHWTGLSGERIPFILSLNREGPTRTQDGQHACLPDPGTPAVPCWIWVVPFGDRASLQAQAWTFLGGRRGSMNLGGQRVGSRGNWPPGCHLPSPLPGSIWGTKGKGSECQAPEHVTRAWPITAFHPMIGSDSGVWLRLVQSE